MYCFVSIMCCSMYCLCCSMYCLCVNVYYCHRMSTQMQLNISYHITYLSYHIISYHIISYHTISHQISYHIISSISFLHQTLSPLNAELNPICHLLALLGGATIQVVSRLRVKIDRTVLHCNMSFIVTCHAIS